MLAVKKYLDELSRHGRQSLADAIKKQMQICDKSTLEKPNPESTDQTA